MIISLYNPTRVRVDVAACLWDRGRAFAIGAGAPHPHFGTVLEYVARRRAWVDTHFVEGYVCWSMLVGALLPTIPLPYRATAVALDIRRES